MAEVPLFERRHAIGVTAFGIALHIAEHGAQRT